MREYFRKLTPPERIGSRQSGENPASRHRRGIALWLWPAGAAASSLWTFPVVLASAIVIAWAAEAAQFLVSQGLALAMLAWLQTLPEFAVEAVIASQAGHVARTGTPDQIASATSLVSANFTGSLRLLVGLGWPMIYATAAYFHRRKTGGRLKRIVLEDEHSVEVVFLLVAVGYFFVIWLLGRIGFFDTGVLGCIYAIYLIVLNKIPPQGEEKLEDIDRIPRFILSQRRQVRNSLIGALFVVGGLVLYFCAAPFLNSLKALAAGLGLSAFVFVQWVAPFLSEFPEKVSAFNWARRVSSAPMALMNMASSNINQWTVLVAMIPVAYSLSLGHSGTIVLDSHQRFEILVTLAQSLTGAFLLANMGLSWWEAILLFVLWCSQFLASGFERPAISMAHPSSAALALAGWLRISVAGVENMARAIKWFVTAVYIAWSSVILLRLAITRRGFRALRIFPALVRQHW